MLNQKRSGKLARLKYLVAVPISAGLLCASTLVFSKSYGIIDLLPGHKNISSAVEAAHNPAVDTSQVNKTSTTTKGYKYEETGYLINNKTDFRVIITEKNGEHKEYYKSKATSEELATLKTKYGYTFPKMLIYPKLPPPPPAPPANGKKPKVTDVKLPPPPPPVNPVKTKKAPKIVEVTPAAPVEAPSPAEPSSLQPPPPPPANPFDALYKYLAKHVRYPARARQNNIWGREIASIHIADNKISQSKIVKSLDPEIDAEVLRVLNDYDGQIGIKQGTYKVDIAMMIATEDGGKTAFDVQSKITDPNAPGYEGTALSQVVVMCYPEKK